jgi:hypothetical protein
MVANLLTLKNKKMETLKIIILSIMLLASVFILIGIFTINSDFIFASIITIITTGFALVVMNEYEKA